MNTNFASFFNLSYATRTWQPSHDEDSGHSDHNYIWLISAHNTEDFHLINAHWDNEQKKKQCVKSKKTLILPKFNVKAKTCIYFYSYLFRNEKPTWILIISIFIIFHCIFLCAFNHVCTVILYQVFLSSTQFSNRFIGPFDWPITGTITLGQRRPWANGNKEVFYTPQSSRTGDSPLDAV